MDLFAIIDVIIIGMFFFFFSNQHVTMNAGERGEQGETKGKNTQGAAFHARAEFINS